MLMFLINHLLSTPDCHPTTAPCLFHLFVLHRHSLLLRHLPTLRSIYESQHTHSHTRRPLHKCVVFFLLESPYCCTVLFFLQNPCCFFSPSRGSRIETVQTLSSRRTGKKSNKQTKRPNEHRPALIRHFVLSHVCLCVCVFATRCTYHDVHEACRLMDMFVITENVMLLFLFVFFLSPSVFSPSIFFVWLLTAVLFLFFFLPSFLSFPHFVLCLCPVPPLFSSSVLQHGPRLCSFASPSSPRPPPPPSLSSPPPADCGKQETSGLSSASGCGRHGEDARAGLEVCVYVPAGVLQGSGDEGPG